MQQSIRVACIGAGAAAARAGTGVTLVTEMHYLMHYFEE